MYDTAIKIKTLVAMSVCYLGIF